MNDINLLVDEMRTPTEEKPAQNLSVTDIIEDITPIEETKAEKAEAIKEDVKKLTSETSADIFIGCFDFVQEQILSRIATGKLNRRLDSLFGDEAIVKMDNTITKLERAKENQSTANLTNDEARIAALLKRHQQVISDIPFTDEETDKIKEPLAKVLAETGGEITPNMAIIMLGLEIMGPRIADAFFE